MSSELVDGLAGLTSGSCMAPEGAELAVADFQSCRFVEKLFPGTSRKAVSKQLIIILGVQLSELGIQRIMRLVAGGASPIFESFRISCAESVLEITSRGRLESF